MQTDGVVMGSPLGPSLANAFLIHHEQNYKKKDALKNFVSFIGKHLCWSLFFLIKLQAFRPTTLLRRDSNTGCFPMKFANFLRTSTSMIIYERLLLSLHYCFT